MPSQLDSAREAANKISGGAVGAGLVLVLFPCMTLVFMMDRFHQNPTFGYPVLAIFGIMILLGALALVSTLFSRLDLSARDEALALPPGSIRATIALALIVLFALLAVMLFQALSVPEGVVIKGVSDAARQQLLADSANADIRVTPVACPAALAPAPGVSAPVPPAAAAAGAVTDPCGNGALFKFDVQVGHPASGPAVDFAKQLLTLIGTLMTSVVSFYFAAKSTENVAARAIESLKEKAADGTVKTDTGTVAGSTEGSAPSEDPEHEHGGVALPTDDKDLPQAAGGVADRPQ